MLKPRIIPCLLLKDGGLVKTVNFKSPTYIGDPVNAVKLFNEKEADELILLDIDATTNYFEPNYKLISQIATECRMPLCYGGGIKTVEQAKKIIGLGVEKLAISSGVLDNDKMINDIASEVGSQSVSVVLDVKKKLFGEYEVYTHNGSKRLKKNPFDLISKIEDMGAGEIVINSIDNDGSMKGYDLDLAKKIRKITNIQLSISGGAGSLDDIKVLIKECGIIGAIAGSLFVFKGRFRAVLINYPSLTDKKNLFKI